MLQVFINQTQISLRITLLSGNITFTNGLIFTRVHNRYRENRYLVMLSAMKIFILHMIASYRLLHITHQNGGVHDRVTN